MKPLSRKILSLALPAIAANITTPLLGLVDMAIVGHLGSPVFIAAIALGGTMFSMLYWVFAFLRMGTGGMVAQAYGAFDRREMSAVFFRGLTMALLAGIALIALSGFLSRVLLAFVGNGDEAALVAERYFNLLIWGAPAYLSTYVLNGWFAGCQAPKKALLTSLIINLTNIAASLVLVYGLGLGVTGVALGTLSAQVAGCLSGLIMARGTGLHRSPLRTVFSSGRLRKFFSLNFDIFLRTLCLVAVTVWFTRAGARQGDIILAANALLLQLFLLFSYMMDGFAYAAEALVGSAVGASDVRAERSVISQIFRLALPLSLIFTVVYAIGAEVIVGLLSDDPHVAAAASDFRWWIVLVPLAGFPAFVWDGVFIGATLSRRMLLAMAVAAAIFFGLYFLLFPVMGNHALWLAFVSYLACRGGVQWLLYRTSPAGSKRR